MLDHPLAVDSPSRVRIIVLFSEATDEVENDLDDTPIPEVKASLRRALQQAKEGKTRPISALWERIDC